MTTEPHYKDWAHPVAETLAAARKRSGAEYVARLLIEYTATWGHTITDARYVEEAPCDEHGRFTWHTHARAVRVEFTADGHPVVIRHDSLIASADCWTVHIDGEPRELPPMRRLLAHEQYRRLAYAAHRAITEAPDVNHA